MSFCYFNTVGANRRDVDAAVEKCIHFIHEQQFRNVCVVVHEYDQGLEVMQPLSNRLYHDLSGKSHSGIYQDIYFEAYSEKYFFTPEQLPNAKKYDMMFCLFTDSSLTTQVQNTMKSKPLVYLAYNAKDIEYASGIQGSILLYDFNAPKQSNKRKHKEEQANTKRQRTRYDSNQELSTFDLTILPNEITLDSGSLLEYKLNTHHESLTVEVERTRIYLNLSDYFESLIPARVRIPTPKLSFDRWIMERRTNDTLDGDPLIPSLSEPLIGPSLQREILEDIPTKVHMFPKNDQDANNSFQKYLQAVEQTTRNVEQNTIPGVLEISDQEISVIRETVERVKKNPVTQKDHVMEQLNLLQTKCGTILQSKLKPVVDQVCVDMAILCDNRSKELRTFIAKQDEKDLIVTIQRQLESVQVMIGDRKPLTINAKYFDKLVELHKLWRKRRGQEEEKEQIVYNAIAKLMLRYHTFFGADSYQSSGLQGALVPSAFQCLASCFGVSMECFASPLNCYYPQYCSAFIDTDSPFGSFGTFFNFYPKSGSFEANPPFTEEIMEKMFSHMEHLLDSTELPLSFAIFVPNWQDCSPVVKLCTSKYTRFQLVLDKYKHKYVTGYQHIEQRKDKVSYMAVHETCVVFLQNQAGFEKWKPTQEKIDLLVKKFGE